LRSIRQSKNVSERCIKKIALKTTRTVSPPRQRERFWGPGVDFVDPKVFRKAAAMGAERAAYPIRHLAGAPDNAIQAADRGG
jgi:hypothetical protein